ncbi:MAG: class I SAM-dependent methyltransferase [Candidatus Omnitrophota bacterium]|nr:class I SAM-dependent methyltransferase [Candidatus Omnitrophota bacterium]
MGTDRGSIKLLMREGSREKFSGHALTIGRQDICPVTPLVFKRWAQDMGFELKKPVTGARVTDVDLFLSAGFDNIDSLDYSDFEKCTIIHDLNKDVPVNLHGKYDLIFDGGTSEHVFNLPKVLENYHKMLKAGGRIIHFLPSTNCVEHGFYMFSPTLFWDYYSANNWEIKDSLFVKYSRYGNNYLMDAYKYVPGCLDRLSYGGLGKNIYYVFFVVKKTDTSTFNASIQQGQYLKRWPGAQAAKDAQSKRSDSLKKVAAMLPERLRSALYLLYRFIVLKIPLKFHLKLIGRY